MVPLSGTTYKSRSVQGCLGFFVALREFASTYPKRSNPLCMNLGVPGGTLGGTSTWLGGTFCFSLSFSASSFRNLPLPNGYRRFDDDVVKASGTSKE